MRSRVIGTSGKPVCRISIADATVVLPRDYPNPVAESRQGLLAGCEQSTIVLVHHRQMSDFSGKFITVSAPSPHVLLLALNRYCGSFVTASAIIAHQLHTKQETCERCQRSVGDQHFYVGVAYE